MGAPLRTRALLSPEKLWRWEIKPVPNEFLRCVLDDLGTLCCTSTSRDLEEISVRYEHEGLSFLTIALPAYGKSFEQALEQGGITDDLFPRWRRRGGMPEFLRGFLRLVFDRGTGRLLDDPSVDAIWAVRQLTLMFAKINLPCTPAREAAAIERYVECEQDTRRADAQIREVDMDRFVRIASVLFGDALSAADGDVYAGRVIPKHGPGSTADKLRGNAKWTQREWTCRLESVFPSWEHLVSGRREDDFRVLSGLRILEPGAERPVEVITVPKTLKTPRIIAKEPTAMQYMQQGLLEVLGKRLRGSDTPWRLIGWGSQMSNRLLARQGSQDGTLATLDLSEASDRVSNGLVRGLLRRHPHLDEAVQACRSTSARVHGHGVIPLAKFASMGSALTFPMEAMVFCTTVFLGIEDTLNRPLTHKDVQSLVGRVRIYGDDIIVPVEYVHAVISRLEGFGLKVNESKSFWTGKFRESCGGDYYDGHDVTVVRLRSVLPTSRRNGSEIISTAATRNLLYKAGMWKTASYLDRVMGRIVPWPRVGERSPVLGRHSFLGPDLSGELDRMHRPLVRGAVPRSKIPVSKLDDSGALLKCLTLGELSRDGFSSGTSFRDVLAERLSHIGLPADGVDHLNRSGRPRRVEIRVGRGPAA